MKLRAVLFSTDKHNANGWVLINIAIKIQCKGFKLMVHVPASSLRTQDTKRNWKLNPACYLIGGTSLHNVKAGSSQELSSFR